MTSHHRLVRPVCPTALRRCCVVLLAGLLAVAGAPAAENAPETVLDDGDPALSLPPFFVEPPSRPERWVHAAGPGFELLTTNDADFARAYTRQYFRQLDLVRQLVPDRYQWRPYQPAQHIVVGTDSRRQETDAAMQQALARIKQQQQQDHVQSAAAQYRRATARAASFLPNLRLSGHDSSTVFAFQDRPTSDPRPVDFALRFIDRSLGQQRDSPAFHFTTGRLEELLRRRTPALPAWLIAGLTGLYRSCSFTETELEIAPFLWHSREQTDQLRRDPDLPRELLVLPALFAAPPPPDPAARRLWERQAELFVRWALLADNQAHRDALWNFVDRLELGQPSDRNFRGAFGFGLSDARDRLSDYLSFASGETHRLTGTAGFELPPITARRATNDLVGRIKGEWERLETSYVRQHAPELTELYLNRARATVQRARESGDTPALQALAGLIEYEAGELDHARAELEAAVLGGERRPRVLQALARLRFDELRARHPTDAPIPGEEIGGVTVLLDAAVKTAPPVAEVYLQLAELWLHTDAVMATSDIATLAAGARFFPHQPGVIARMALLQLQRGQAASALQIVGYARSRCRDVESARLYDKLRGQIQDAQPRP